MRIFAVLVLLVSAAAWGQGERGSIVGRVRDHQSLARIPGISVVIRNLTTKDEREVSTSATGEYDSLPLPPGRYAVIVRHHEFRGYAEQRQDVTLSAGQRLELNFEVRKHSLTGAVVLGVLTLLGWIGHRRITAAWARRVVLAICIVMSIAFCISALLVPGATSVTK